MKIDMYKLIQDNYSMLFSNYCKFKDPQKLTDASTCEDIFNSKILMFMETDLDQPTLELLQLYIKTSRTQRKYITLLEFNETYHTPEPSEDDIMIDKLKYLFIDYRKKN